MAYIGKQDWCTVTARASLHRSSSRSPALLHQSTTAVVKETSLFILTLAWLCLLQIEVRNSHTCRLSYLLPGQQYHIQVRTKPDGLSLDGFWGPWSPSVLAETPHLPGKCAQGSTQDFFPRGGEGKEGCDITPSPSPPPGESEVPGCLFHG